MSVSKSQRLLKGFLLFELMVAVVILSVSLTVVSRSFIQSLVALQSSSRFFQGELLLEKKILELDQEELTAGKKEGNFEEEGSFHWTTDMKEEETAPLYESLVTVDWETGGRKQGFSITTYLPKPHEE